MESLKNMTDEELKELANRRVKRTGSFKKSALKAQNELWNRYNWGNEEKIVEDGFCERGLEDIQYNGFMEGEAYGKDS